MKYAIPLPYSCRHTETWGHMPGVQAVAASGYSDFELLEPFESEDEEPEPESEDLEEVAEESEEDSLDDDFVSVAGAGAAVVPFEPDERWSVL